MALILLVEDEPWLGQLYLMLLQKAGHKVFWCQNNYQAIDALDDFKPQLIVLDLLLPWSNGLQLLHEIASHSDLMTIPVILCSNALPPDNSWLSQYGIVEVFNKTEEQPPQLIKKVNKAVLRA